MEFPAAEEDGAGCGFPTRRLVEQDLLIAETLLELPRLFLEWESRNRRSSTLNLRWAAKRKRSKASQPPIGAAGPAPSPEEPGPSKPWTDSSSPDTPLIVSYSGGSSEPKSGAVATNRRKSIKWTREELQLAVSVAQRERERLEGQIEILRRKIEGEKSLNMELKRKQKLLIPCREEARRKKVSTCLTLAVLSSPSDEAELLHPQLSVLDVSEHLIPKRMAAGADKSAISGAGARALSSSLPGIALLDLSLGSPPLVPDMDHLPGENGSASNSQPLEHVILDRGLLSRAAAAARARQRRYLINKAKLRR